MLNPALLLRGEGVRGRQFRRALTAYLFMLPAFVLIGAFTLTPFVQGVALSFQSWDGVGTDTPFVGLANYERAGYKIGPEFPNLLAWWERMKARPSFAASLPPD